MYRIDPSICFVLNRQAALRTFNENDKCYEADRQHDARDHHPGLDYADGDSAGYGEDSHNQLHDVAGCKDEPNATADATR